MPETTRLGLDSSGVQNVEGTKSIFTAAATFGVVACLTAGYVASAVGDTDGNPMVLNYSVQGGTNLILSWSSVLPPYRLQVWTGGANPRWTNFGNELFYTNRAVVRIRKDAAGPMIFRVRNLPDADAPTFNAGGALTLIANSCRQVRLSWPPAHDNEGGSGVAGYRIYRNGSLQTNSVTPSFQDNSASGETTYRYRVTALDLYGNESTSSFEGVVTTASCDLRAAAGPDRTAAVGTPVEFSGRLSTAPGGHITAYRWNFGDGQFAVGVSAAHTYAESGVYTVTLTVTDDANTSSSDALVATVTPRVRPVGDLYALKSHLPGMDSAQDIAVVGSHAYLTSPSFGLTIYDVSGTNSPVALGSSDVPFIGNFLAVSGNYAVVTGSRRYYSRPGEYNVVNGIYLIDVSDPASPVVKNRIEDNGFYNGVVVSGNYAYVAGEAVGLLVLDISSPSAFRIISTNSVVGSAKALAVGGKYLYLADGPSGMRVFDLTNPAAPSLVGKGFDTPGQATDVKVDGQIAYVADKSSLRALDISNPELPRLLRSTNLAATHLAIDGDSIFVVGGYQRLTILRKADLHIQGELVYEAPQFSHAQSIAVQGGIAYLADAGAGLGIVDISDRTSPRFLHREYSVFRGENLAALSDRVVVTGNSTSDTQTFNEIQIFSLRDGSGVPKRTAVIESFKPFKGVALKGEFAYVASESGSLEIFDISDLAHPRLTNSVDLGGASAVGVVLVGDLAYLSCHRAGIIIVSIADPATAAVVKKVSGIGDVKTFAFEGSVGCAVTPSKLVMLDLTDPLNPQVMQQPGSGWAVEYTQIRNGYLYAVGGRLSLNIYKIENFLLQEVGSVPLSFSSKCYPNSVAVSGSKAYVANSFGGLAVVDLTTLEAPTLEATLLVVGGAQKAVVQDGIVFVADSFASLDTISIVPKP